ncbi:MAG: SDR family NAD(P)-dependent oxidoreductase [Clostridia bacterium]|nr:SDR family NAD(P)-dependent oxidoreductase [Clostridia bacterium]
MKESGYALITGATGGLGKAFVFALAKRGYPLVLTGRSEEKLLALKAELAASYAQLPVLVCAADLADENSRAQMTEKLSEQGVRIRLLVNAAGADIQKEFTAYTQEKIVFQCRANFEAAVSMCHFALHNRAERLEIVNIASVSGIYPMPYFAIYSAAKSALVSFSVALREELRGKNAAVTAILPGAMPTRADIKAQIEGQGLWGRLAVKSPEWVAEYSLKAVRKNKAKRIAGFWNKVMRVSTALLPNSVKLRFIARRWSKISKDAF